MTVPKQMTPEEFAKKEGYYDVSLHSRSLEIMQAYAAHVLAAEREREPKKLSPREWLCSGGGGHEDGEDGIRACTMPMEHAIELMEEYVEYLREPAECRASQNEPDELIRWKSNAALGGCHEPGEGVEGQNEARKR